GDFETYTQVYRDNRHLVSRHKLTYERSLIAMGERAVADNTVQRIKQIDAERSKLLEASKKEALDRVSQALEDLRDLGFTYLLVNETRGRPRKRAKRAVPRKRQVECPICKFMTSPPHDARKHRFTQGKRKRAFTVKELADFGLKRVG